MATQLRQRFENYLTLQRFSNPTKRAYIQAVAGLARFHHRPPDMLVNAQIQQYLVHLIDERKLAWSTCNVAFSALQCFYIRFLGRKETEISIPPRGRQSKLPEILNRKEVEKLIDSAKNFRHQALLLMTYGSGLRVSEVVRLKMSHIDAERKLVRVEQGKGRKDRYTLLSMKALETLRIYCKSERPVSYLFFGRDKTEPMPIYTAQKIYRATKKAAGIEKGQGIHTLRHCFATHLLEQGTDIFTIKRLMGHRSIQTTIIYLHFLPDRMAAEVRSPLDSPPTR